METEAARLDHGADGGLGRGAVRAQLGHPDTALRWVGWPASLHVLDVDILIYRIMRLFHGDECQGGKK